MTANTKIEWADSTFNPWTGCTKVSPGCDGCYAEGWSKRAGPKVGKWGPGMPRVRTSAANWRKPLQWNAATFVQCAQCGHRCDLRDFKDKVSGWTMCPVCSCSDYHGARRRVFCASLADVFDNEVPDTWRADLFALIDATPQLDWLLLTKRIGNVVPMLKAARRLRHGIDAQGIHVHPRPNVWLGATICNQEEADRDIRKLLAVPAAKRFLSMEPLLGPVKLTNVPMPESGHGHHEFDPIITGNALKRADSSKPKIDWIIVGGESGPGARPMDPRWVRGLRNQCKAAGVSFFFKQWGEFLPQSADIKDPQLPDVDDSRLYWSDGSKWERQDGQRGGVDLVARVGKKAAGRVLDGRTWDEVPA